MPPEQNEWSVPDHNTGNFMPYSLRIVCGFFNVPQLFKGCETGPPAYSPYPRRLESLTICWCNYKGSTFYSVILRPWVLVRPESNSRPPASQPNAQQLSHRFAELHALWLFCVLICSFNVLFWWDKTIPSALVLQRILCSESVLKTWISRQLTNVCLFVW